MKNTALIKYFIAVFLISFVVFNWNDISWVFNYRFVADYIDVAINGNRSVPNTTAEVETQIKGEPTDKENGIEIAKISITAPLVLSEKSDNASLEQDLKSGVIHYPESVMPGVVGRTIILGHSAPANYPKIRYDWVFSDLNKLDINDEIIVYYEHQKFTYKITEKVILEKGQDLPTEIESQTNTLLLLSCWPPGKDYKRIGVFATLNPLTN